MHFGWFFRSTWDVNPSYREITYRTFGKGTSFSEPPWEGTNVSFQGGDRLFFWLQKVETSGYDLKVFFLLQLWFFLDVDYTPQEDLMPRESLRVFGPRLEIRKNIWTKKLSFSGSIRESSEGVIQVQTKNLKVSSVICLSIWMKHKFRWMCPATEFIKEVLPVPGSPWSR